MRCVSGGTAGANDYAGASRKKAGDQAEESCKQDKNRLDPDYQDLVIMSRVWSGEEQSGAEQCQQPDNQR